MPNVMESVGGSIGCAGSGVSTSGAQMVCETVASGRPATETMSPASASSTGVRSSPRKASTLETRPCSIRLPWRSSTLAGAFGRIDPDVMRPVTTRPR